MDEPAGRPEDVVSPARAAVMNDSLQRRLGALSAVLRVLRRLDVAGDVSSSPKLLKCNG